MCSLCFLYLATPNPPQSIEVEISATGFVTISWADSCNSSGCSVEYFIKINNKTYGPQEERNYIIMNNTLSTMEQTVSVWASDSDDGANSSQTTSTFTFDGILQ